METNNLNNNLSTLTPEQEMTQSQLLQAVKRLVGDSRFNTWNLTKIKNIQEYKQENTVSTDLLQKLMNRNTELKTEEDRSILEKKQN